MIAQELDVAVGAAPDIGLFISIFLSNCLELLSFYNECLRSLVEGRHYGLREAAVK